ncbi:NYN domain-containing protein [Microlunatus ginsengisoli]|uniref:NYN domain-containing protein n=1 Tax=Microlunatus ginsengisoli TaxID=363863 RepID=A0ABP7ALE1_9ACTN
MNTRSHPPTPDPPPAGAPGLPDRAPILGPARCTVPVLVDAGYVLALAAQRNQATVSNCIFDVSRIVGLLRDALRTQLAELPGPTGPGPTGPGPTGPGQVAFGWYDADDRTGRLGTPWLAALRAEPDVQLRLGTVQRDRTGRLRQKRVDTLLVADLVELAYHAAPPADVVLLAGDDDLSPGVEVARRRGLRVHLCAIVDGGRAMGVSSHLRGLVDTVLTVDVANLSAAATNRSRLFARMAGLGAPSADEHSAAAGTGVEPAGAVVLALTAAVMPRRDFRAWVQPVLPGMPDPARRGLRPGRDDGTDRDGGAGTGPAPAPQREVSRAWLAGRSFADRWLQRTAAAERDRLLGEIADRAPFLPLEVDAPLLRFGAAHVRVRDDEHNRTDLRAGFLSGVERAAGTGPAGDGPARNGPRAASGLTGAA